MASGTTFFIPSNGANMIQTTPGLPSIAVQASGATPYLLYGAQQLQIPTSAPQQVPQNGPLERFLKAEPKVLGAIQIMIGLLHVGFGAVSHQLFSLHYFTLNGIGGYPFWGGLFFISTGSLCVAAMTHPSPDLVKSSVGMNIASAIMALTGIILYTCKIIIITIPVNNATVVIDTVRQVSYGFSSLFLLFSLLEFCIAVSLAHFGCQATCCSGAQPTNHFVPYQIMGDEAVTTEQNPPPPAIYNNMVTTSQ
ncbi:membrane-spanning 4-domains subfamily A member 15-like [Pantherophis guttatus]|uniref:Membrane-spanning 4-domains subfamily A member 15-like n=1 Tax=Pantherophis guttatus TaxID=94885 RepID=A0A6P9BWP4_PANGU|nr:membrane-spanning 4-domains subfamily A member 15-like [Pantherophis guttatus]XP_034276133.1 membrane-spanning 4-domains subfamily A member 15-like [Pantherophis guttatus]XP_034276134.1 membrane-spanning 4-domains subfamily A member 15-like [Pantherophis guttatus]